MNPDEFPSSLATPSQPPHAKAPEGALATASPGQAWARWTPWLTWVLMLAIGGYAWQTSRRLGHLEAELVKRQESSQTSAQEALLLARQSQDLAREASAQVALFNAKLAEVNLQRTQLDALLQSLSQTRDDNLLADVDASLRVAMQQAGLTGSAEPLVAALQAADERLTRMAQPRFEPVRRALIKDLDELRGTQLSDVASLAIRLDEATRLVDDLPLLSQAQATAKHQAELEASTPPTQRENTATSPHWSDRLMRWGQSATQSAWQEAKTLIRVTRIAQPEAALLAPEQAYFLKENLKLRLLNARLSLLSRQTSTAMTDLQSAKMALDKYFDPRARKTAVLKNLLNDVAIQARQVQVPTPDDTLAALHSLGSKP